MPAVGLDLAAEVLLGEAVDRGGPLWLVLGAGADRHHPVLDRALRLCVDTVGREPGVGPLLLRGEVLQGRRMLRVVVSDAAPAVVAVLLAVRAHTGMAPHLSCDWPQRHPLVQLIAVAAGVPAGSVWRIRRLVHRAEPDPSRRPIVHVW